MNTANSKVIFLNDPTSRLVVYLDMQLTGVSLEIRSKDRYSVNIDSDRVKRHSFKRYLVKCKCKNESALKSIFTE